MSWINNNAGSIVAANSPFLPLPEDNMQTELQQLFTNGATGFMVAFGLIVAIGAQNAWVLNKSLRGEHPWVITAVCVAIDITLISVGVFTISQIQQWLPPLIPAVTLFGVLFLCWLSAQAFYRAWLGGAGLATSTNSQLSSPWRSAGQACAISLLTPCLSGYCDPDWQHRRSAKRPAMVYRRCRQCLGAVVQQPGCRWSLVAPLPDSAPPLAMAGVNDWPVFIGGGFIITTTFVVAAPALWCVFCHH